MAIACEVPRSYEFHVGIYLIKWDGILLAWLRANPTATVRLSTPAEIEIVPSARTLL
jgi:hypothetical protein